MTDKTSLADKALLEILNRTLQAGDFMAEQAPLVVQELLNYKTASHAIGLIFLSLLAVLFIFASKYLYKKSEKLREAREDSEGYVPMSAISLLISVAFAFCAVTDLVGLIKVIISPRVYLLEYAAALVK